MIKSQVVKLISLIQSKKDDILLSEVLVSKLREGIDEMSLDPNIEFDILSEILSVIILKINILILDFNLIYLFEC